MADDGGAIIGRILASRGVKQLFTLCGGHISPILVGAEANGIKVVDVRDEVSAVFAADAVARMTGIPGSGRSDCGPGRDQHHHRGEERAAGSVAAGDLRRRGRNLLKGRGALQDIDQISVMESITKWAVSIKKVHSIGPTVEKAMDSRRTAYPGRSSSRCRSTSSTRRDGPRDVHEGERGQGRQEPRLQGARALHARPLVPAVPPAPCEHRPTDPRISPAQAEHQEPPRRQGRVAPAQGRAPGARHRQSGPGQLPGRRADCRRRPCAWGPDLARRHGARSARPAQRHSVSPQAKRCAQGG